MAQESKVIIIAAIGKNRELGKDGKLLWHIPEDLKHFKELTVGNVVIMGRKTFESLPDSVRPLPGRVNIVVTRNSEYQKGNYLVAPSVETAVEQARGVGTENIFIIGGGEIYREALPYADRLELTVIDSEDAAADTFFPEYDVFSKVVSKKESSENNLSYTFYTLEK